MQEADFMDASPSDGQAPNAPRLDDLDLTPEERREWEGLAFFSDEIQTFSTRGLIPEAALTTILGETEGRQRALFRTGTARANLNAARRIRSQDPAEALRKLEQARAIAPDLRDAWLLAIQILEDRLDADAALALCEEANQRFAEFPLALSSLKERLALKKEPFAGAEAALKEGRDREVIALCTTRLYQDPDYIDALVFRAFARQRSGLVDAALEDYRRLAQLQPENPTWDKWIQSLKTRERPAAQAPARQAMASPSATPPPRPVPSIPKISWSEISSQFLQAHWQKLILCLAVLLIVVSSNMGAYQLLGPKLWSPIGKCILALVYTGMFTGFGAGLARWGAQRAGRIMLLTTLVMIPANFMLVGEMRLLTEPSASRMLVFALDALALFLLIQLVLWSLDWKHGGKLFGVIFLVQCAFNAGSSPGLEWQLGWQVALLLAPALVFLAAVIWVGTSFQEKQVEDRAEITYFALAIFSFAFLTGLIRTGVFTLHLEATFYAIPLMLMAIASLFTASRLSKFDPDAKHEAWMRYGGLVVSGVGIALALARPPSPSALYSGNTLATAILGLGLYSAALSKTRKPAYLYFAFGALFLAYFGAFFFVVDLVRSVEEAARQALGYHQKLPPPFKAINGLAFNSVLGLLCLYFQRVWNDPRLARHCHYIGVPFSIAACVFSTLEPKAGLICLTGYSVLYLIATRIFAQPRAIYLAAASFAGAVYFATQVLGGSTLSQAILIEAILAIGYWLVAVVLGRRTTDTAYRVPLERASLGLASLMTLCAIVSVIPRGVASWEAAAALGLTALIYALANLERKAERFAYAVAITGSLGYAFLVNHALSERDDRLGLAPYALAAGASALVLSSIGDWARRVLNSGADALRLAPYPSPLLTVALIQASLTILACVLRAEEKRELLSTLDFATMAFGLLFACRALMIITHAYPLKILAVFSIACGLGFWVCAFQALNQAARSSLAVYGLAVSSYSLVMLLLEEGAKRLNGKKKNADPDFAVNWFPSADLFASVLPISEVVVTLFACGLAVCGLDNSLPLSITFGLSAAAMIWSSRFRLYPGIVDLGLAYAVIAVLCLTGWRFGGNTFGVTVGWLALSSAFSTLILTGFGRYSESKSWGNVYSKSCFRAGSILSWLVMIFVLLSRIDRVDAYRLGTAALLVNTLSLLGLSWFRGRPNLSYRGFFAFTMAVYLVVLSVGKPNPNSAYILGLVAVSVALLFSMLGFVARLSSEEAWNRLVAVPLFNSALVLTVLAAIPAYESPWTSALIALSYLLFVKGIPSRNWLYPSIAFLANAIYFGFVIDFNITRYVIAAMVAAYQLWLFGLLVRRLEPALRRWLNLKEEPHDEPFFNAAIVFALLAAILRLNETQAGAMKWTDSAGLTLNLAVFCLCVVKAYPWRFWVHCAVVLASASAVMAAAPEPGTLAPWLLMGMVLSIGWIWISEGLTRVDEPIRRRLGLEDIGVPEIARLWSQAFFAITSPVIGVVVVLAMLKSLWGFGSPGIEVGPWHRMLLAIGLGAFAVVSLFWGKSLAGLLGGLWAFVLASLWWLSITRSPIVIRLGLSTGELAPILTANLSFATLMFGLLWRSPRPALQWLLKRHGLAIEESARFESLAYSAGMELGWVALVMTFGVMRHSDLITSGIIALGFTITAVAANRLKSARSAGFIWLILATGVGRDLIQSLGIGNDAEKAIVVGVAYLGLAALLWIFTGLLRKRRTDIASEDQRLWIWNAGSIPAIFEGYAILIAFLSGLMITISATFEALPGSTSAYIAVTTLLGLTLFFIAAILRSRLEWLVYTAQASLVGSYLYYRWAFPLPAATDAVILTLFGYLDLGLAEALNRVGLGHYAKPTRYVAIALPVLPLVFAFWDLTLSGSDLFILFSVATFYAIACERFAWKGLGYASAVLYNAFLWFLWGRFGWSLSDHSQFFLIPVGFSAILFAEVNVKELGRSGVNTLRSVGLILIYLSLAAPIWQTQSFGAWLTLLLISLAGIFAGIALRAQTFLWLGLVGFVLDVVYQLGRVSMDNTLARWGIMLILAIMMVLFVALNEKKEIVISLRQFVDKARRWE